MTTSTTTKRQTLSLKQKKNLNNLYTHTNNTSIHTTLYVYIHNLFLEHLFCTDNTKGHPKRLESKTLLHAQSFMNLVKIIHLHNQFKVAHKMHSQSVQFLSIIYKQRDIQKSYIITSITISDRIVMINYTSCVQFCDPPVRKLLKFEQLH